jgi:predicted TIM-barrel fold metal-dependent hydrolase
MRALLATLLMALASSASSQVLPIFDAHLHYSHDAWETVPVEQAIDIMRKAGVRRALISSSGDEGQQRLYRAAPDLVIPELRPYRSRGEIGTWFRDDSVIAYLEDRLKRHKYVGIGEFHLYGADADLPVPRRMVELARRHRLFLHAHSDADAIERLFKQWPQARILWAHAGFERPERVAEMLRKHRNLWCDLAFRTDHASGSKVDPAWRAAFLQFPDRFMVGTDSYTPERWHYIPGHADWSRQWLADLPRDVAERIAWKNGETVFGSLLPPH